MTHRILIIRFSSIGDIILTTPVIRAVRRQLDAEVHFLTKAKYQSVLAHNPHIHQLHTIERSVSEVLPALRRFRPTAIVDLHHNLRSLQVKLALPWVPHYSFDKLNHEKWLLTQWHIQWLPRVHIVDRYLAAAAPLGVIADGKGLDYFLGQEDELPEAMRFSEPFLALVIGAAHATKRLPEEQLAAFCSQFTRPIAVLGGPEEAEVGERLAALGSHVSNTCGKLRLNQSAALVRQAAVVVTHDTGLMHMAAAFRRPIISIWGNTVPEFGMTPYFGKEQPPVPHRLFEVKGLGCRPCSKIGYPACPKGHFRCMNDLSMAEVAAAANQLMEAP